MRATIVVVLLLFQLKANAQDENVLPIDPVYQQTPVWCWVSVGEMIFRYNDVCCINPGGDYQCGIIALIGPVCNQNCYNCQVPSGSAGVIQNMLREYPKVARQVCGSGQAVSSTLLSARISGERIITEIDGGRPVIAGISPQGNFGAEPAHVALIIGYEVADNADELYIVVNDPFPYPSSSDPYVRVGGEFVDSGQYKISYDDFLKLNWTKTFVNIN